MHYIKVPETVVINLEMNGESKVDELPFSKFAENAIYDPKLGKTAKDIVRVIKLKKKFDDTKPGDIIALEDADWEKLKDVVESPTTGYNTRVMSQAYPYIEAILEATTEDPSKKEE